MQTHHRVASALGYAGIVPIMLGMAAIPHPLAEQGLRLYGLAIIAFVCGNAWTVSLMHQSAQAGARVRLLVGSNAIVLVAAAAALWFDNTVVFMTYALLFALLLGLDLKAGPFAPQPPYYRRLRIVVSVAVTATYILAALRV